MRWSSDWTSRLAYDLSFNRGDGDGIVTTGNRIGSFNDSERGFKTSRLTNEDTGKNHQYQEDKRSQNQTLITFSELDLSWDSQIPD